MTKSIIYAALCCGFLFGVGFFSGTQHGDSKARLEWATDKEALSIAKSVAAQERDEAMAKYNDERSVSEAAYLRGRLDAAFTNDVIERGIDDGSLKLSVNTVHTSTAASDTTTKCGGDATTRSELSKEDARAFNRIAFDADRNTEQLTLCQKELDRLWLFVQMKSAP